jgi:hypothetical protein
MSLKEFEICKCITESERKTKKTVCIGKIHGSAIFEQIQDITGTYKYAIYEEMENNTWRLDTRLEYEGFIPLTKTPLTHPPPPTEYENEEILYNNVKAYIQKHLDLVNPLGYEILTSFIFKTWIEELFDFTPYVGFFGRENVGKSRALEILKELCFRAWLTTGITTATLFRLIEKFQPTLLLDESEFLTSDEKRELIGLINAGQRRGIMIPRMNEKFQEAEFFNVYGSKCISGTEQLKATTKSRMITFTMTRNIRPIPRTLDKTEASKLRGQLLMWRFQTIAKLKEQKLATATTEFKELEPLSGRTFELFYPLYFSAPATARPNILVFATELEQSKLLAEKTELASQIFEAIINLKDIKTYKGLLLIKDIAQHINKDLETQYWVAEKRIGTKLSQMGFEKTRTNRGTAIILNNTIIERLKRDPRYSTELLNFSEKSEEREAKKGSVAHWETVDK